METTDKNVSDFSVFLRVIKTGRKEWRIAILGVMGAIMLGAAFPTFALLFGEILEAFVQPPSLVLSGIHLWAGLFFLLGFLAGLGGFIKVSVIEHNLHYMTYSMSLFRIYVLQTFCFSVSGENLTLRLRYQAFKAMMRQEMGWFDEEDHSTGALTSTLADDTRNVQGVSFSFGTHYTKHSYKNRCCMIVLPASQFTMSNHAQGRMLLREQQCTRKAYDCVA